jgi:hypothetical protein
VADYPVDRPARMKRRAEIRESFIAKAEAMAARAGRSITCGELPRDRHETCFGAVACLCECHDGPAS